MTDGHAVRGRARDRRADLDAVPHRAVVLPLDELDGLASGLEPGVRVGPERDVALGHHDRGQRRRGCAVALLVTVVAVLAVVGLLLAAVVVGLHRLAAVVATVAGVEEEGEGENDERGDVLVHDVTSFCVSDDADG